jgi:predicted DNA-binding WGR domain protein
MPKKPTHYTCTGWYMEYVEGTSAKFYQVIISETGICVLRWGRIGAAGTPAVTRYSTYDEARDQGLKQVFAKKAKGYVQKYGDFNFVASVEALDHAMNDHTAPLVREWTEALEKGEWDGAKQTVLKQYAEFSERVKLLMDRAGGGDFDATMDEYTALEEVWSEINDKHGEVEAAMSLAKMTLMQRLMSGSVS